MIELDEEKFAGKTLKYIYSIENTYRECTLFINLLNPIKKYKELKECDSLLRDKLSKLEFIIDYDEVSVKNNVEGFSTDYSELLKIGDERFAKENFSKTIFWANEKEEKDYKEISNFECFRDVVISREMINKTIINIPFNLEGWTKYYQNLLAIKFPEFLDEIIIRGKIIRYRQFKYDFYIGVETDYKKFQSSLKKDYDAQPLHKLIIFKILNKKQIETFLTFDKFVHPHFDPPAYSFGSYFYAENSIRVSEDEHSLKYTVEREILDDGSVKLSMSENFGEHLKRHAFFYYDMLNHTTKEYIKFIEESFDSSTD